MRTRYKGISQEWTEDQVDLREPGSYVVRESGSWYVTSVSMTLKTIALNTPRQTQPLCMSLANALRIQKNYPGYKIYHISFIPGIMIGQNFKVM